MDKAAGGSGDAPPPTRMHLEADDTCGGQSGLRARLEGSGLSIFPPSRITIRDRPQNHKSDAPSQARARPPPLVSLPEVLQRDLTAPTTPMGLGGPQRPGRGATPMTCVISWLQ